MTLTARPFSLTGFERLDDDVVRFELNVHTSLGLLKLRSLRYKQSSEAVLFPGFPTGGHGWYPHMILTPHQKSLVKKLVIRALALEKNPTPELRTNG